MCAENVQGYNEALSYKANKAIGKEQSNRFAELLSTLRQQILSCLDLSGKALFVLKHSKQH